MRQSAKAVRIDAYTSSVSPIDMYFDEKLLGRGTAFYWNENGKNYLVTNWHNVTGKDPRTGRALRKDAAVPNRFLADAFDNEDINQRLTGSFSLFKDGVPTWFEHPEYKERVDVVCMEIDLEGHSVFPINKLTNDFISLTIAQDIFILGYPMGIDTNRLAIWKRGSVASEPDVDVDDLPMFYVDSATSKGMSGSPVILRKQPGLKETGHFEFNTVPISRFIGVYSGRLAPRDKVEAHLGFVWKQNVIPEIISGRCTGSVG